jgi:hypothetical protein
MVAGALMLAVFTVFAITGAAKAPNTNDAVSAAIANFFMRSLLFEQGSSRKPKRAGALR